MDAKGKEQKGKIQAANEEAVMAALRAKGMFPTSIKLEVGKDAAKKMSSKGGAKSKGGGGFNMTLGPMVIKRKELTVVTRQLAILLDAGLPLIRSLRTLEKQAKNPVVRVVLGKTAETVEGGATFAEALSQNPKSFDKLYLNMVRAGEASGAMETILDRLASFMEKSAKIAGKVKSAMIYPIVVLLAAVGITAFLMIQVIPKFQQVFADMLGGEALPMITQMVIDASGYVQHNGLQILGIIVALVIIRKVVGRTEKGAYFFDALSLKVPVTGTLVQRTAVSRVTRTLGTLLASGVPILQALQIVRDTAGNRVIANALQTVHDAVKEGESMTDPLAASGVFPPMVVSMVQVGEETGALADMLTRIANTYDDEVDNAVAGLTAAIEPALIIFLAVVVGTIVIAMFLPMIKIISSVSGAGAGM